jgi:RNA polymerase sigma factor (sigma-70 family)
VSPTTKTFCWSGLQDQRPIVLRFLARRCRDEHEAEDLAQETLLRAARYRKGVSHNGRLGSWLVQIAANVLRDHARREGRGPLSGCEEGWIDLVEDPQPGPGESGRVGTVPFGDHLVDVDDALLDLQAATTRLMEHDRAVLSAYYGAGECTRTAAAECGIQPSLVKVRLFRARRRLERLVLMRSSQRRSRQLSLSA